MTVRDPTDRRCCPLVILVPIVNYSVFSPSKLKWGSTTRQLVDIQSGKPCLYRRWPHIVVTLFKQG